MDYKKFLDKSWKIGSILGLSFTIITLYLSCGLKLMVLKNNFVVCMIIFLGYLCYGTFLGFVLLNTLKNYKKHSNLFKFIRIIIIFILFIILVLGTYLSIVFLSPAGCSFVS